MMKRIILGIYLILGILCFGEEKLEEKQIVAKLVETKNGSVIEEINGEKIHPLASLTKMMTVLLTYDAIESGAISLNDMVPIPEESKEIKGSRIWTAKKNDELSVEDLLKATAIYSANNAAYTLAYYISNGDVDKFVEKMNEKAKELGMKNTKFYTPTGLPSHMTEKGMDTSTVKDIYILSKVLLENENYMKMASMKESSIRNGEQKIKNRNKLLGEIGIYGMKTGHHTEAGFNISVVTKKDDKAIIEVVFGAPTEKIRDNMVLEDLNRVYMEYETKYLLNKGEKLGSAKIVDGEISEISFYAEKDYSKFLPKNVEIKKELKLYEPIEAPLKAGTKVGEYRVFIDGKLYLKSDLVVKVDVKKLNFFQKIFN
jgi:D-alanyl-D-alanine carboxypeptidase (penicillin-binding protein 5/6)